MIVTITAKANSLLEFEELIKTSLETLEEKKKSKSGITYTLNPNYDKLEISIKILELNEEVN